MKTTKKVTAIKAKTKKAPVKKYAKGGLKKYQAAGTKTSSMTRTEALLNPNAVTFPFTSSNGAIYMNMKDLQSGTPTNPSKAQSMMRQKALSDSTTTFPYTSSSGATYGSRKSLQSGTPTNPNKLKRGGMFKTKTTAKKTVTRKKK